MKKVNRAFYLTESAHRALNQMYIDQMSAGPKVSYSELVSRAIESFETVGFKRISCKDMRCGYYYIYQCYCGNTKEDE